jgi:exodeoxyribonuclease VII small subunit
MAKKSEKPIPERLEEALAELEQIVEKMESPELALEESMELFERGHKLSLVCQERLQEADRKVEILLKKTDRPQSAGDFVKKNFLEDADESF